MRSKQAKSFRRVLFLSFALPLLLLLAAYFIMQFWPVGDRSPLTIDLYHQYVAFISELRRKLIKGESLFYSWSVGLGTNFYALMAYYAASPMNLFLLFFPQNHITEAVTFLIVTKIGLSGLSFAAMLGYGMCRKDGLYTVRITEDKRNTGGEDYGTDAVIVALSVAYALSAFNLAYSWDIMWLDVIALLPMVVLGIHQLVRERRFALYAASLALTLIINYYMAFFVCLFSALYFFVAYLSAKAAEQQRERQAFFLLNGEKILIDPGYAEKQYDPLKFWPTALRFAFITLLGAALSAFMLWPTAVSLAQTSAAGDSFPASMSFRFGLFDFMTQELMNIPPSIRRGLPNVYCGILAFVFLPLYVISQRIPLKEKASHLALLAFLFLSFNINILDFIWHGFHYPNQLPYRYSFLFSFTLLLIVFRTLTVIREFSAKLLVTTAGLGIIFVILAEKLNEELLAHGHAYINIFFFLIYLLIFSMIRRPNYFRTVALLMAVVMVGELAINTIITVADIGENEVYTSRSSFVGDFGEVEGFLEEVREREGDNFYRMELMPAKTTNDGALYGYPGYTLFSSTSREDTAKFMRKFAYHGNNINSYKYVASTPVGNSLFGIKYLLYKNGAPRDRSLVEVSSHDDMTLYENPYALGPAIAARPTFARWNPSHASPFMNWNKMLEEMAGIPQLFEPLDITVTSGANYQPSTGDAEHGRSFTPEHRDRETLMRVEVPIEQDTYFYYAVDTNRKTTVDITIRHPQTGGGETLPVGSSPEASRMTEAATTHKQSRSVRWLETFDLGFCRAGDVAELSFKQDKENAADVTVYAAALDPEAYEAAMRELAGRQAEVTEWRSSGLSLQTTLEQDALLFFSIPYDDSWQITIDGEPAEREDIGNKALLAVPVKAGRHEIDLNFRPKGFVPGVILSLAGLLIFILLLIDQKKYKPARDRRRIETGRAKAIARQEARRQEAAKARSGQKSGRNAAGTKAAVRPSHVKLPSESAESAAGAPAEEAPEKAAARPEEAGTPPEEAPERPERSDEVPREPLPDYRPSPAVQPQWDHKKFTIEKTGE